MSDTPEVLAPVRQPVRSRRGRRIMGLILAVLIILLLAGSFLLYRIISGPIGSRAGVAGTDAGGLTWVRSIYGMSDRVEDQLDLVNAAVPGADGSIWVIDASKRSLIRFTPDGRYVESITGPTEQPLGAPSRFAISPDGSFYVCETPSDAIRVLNPDGTEGNSILIPQPLSVAVSDDMIVVGSIAGFAILNMDGEPQQVIGTRGKGDDQFDYVHGVAIGQDDTIYVADSFNNRLSAWDRDGNRLWIRRTGTPGNSAQFDEKEGLVTQDTSDSVLPEPERLQLPLGMTLDGAGRIVVIDMFESAIAVFDPEDGAFIGKYGVTGPEDGEFFYPQSIGYDPARDWFTVADSLNNRVQVVRIPGSSGGGGAVEAVRRLMAGPVRACLFPLALLLLALVGWFVSRVVRKRRPVADEQRESS